MGNLTTVLLPFQKEMLLAAMGEKVTMKNTP
jgi:hypothetical protein